MKKHLLPAVAPWILAGILVVSSPGAALAQGLEYVKANYTKHEHMVPMRDGVKLFTVVFAPKDASRKHPILLLRTQSGVLPYGPDEYKNDLGPSPLFAKEGYIFVYQDIRGRWASEGVFENMRPHNPAKKGPADIDESSDTYDTVEWLVKNVANHNGKVGLYGTSYRGFLVSAGIIDAHPAIVAASPGAPIMDWFVGDDWRHNGAFFLAHAFFYMPLQGRARFEPFKKLAHPPFDFGTADSYDFYLRLGPLANADLRHFKGEIPYWNKLLEHNTYDDFWKARNLRPHLKNIKPAVLTVGGWFDAENLFGVLEAYRRFESGSPGATSTLVMGPWSHGGWNSGPGSSLGNVAFGAKTAEHYREKIELPFFEHHLKGKEMAPLAEALVFETGTNRWREYPSWPPKDTRPVTWHLHAGGKLAHEPPAGAAGEFDEYTSDPARPIPYTEKLGIRMIADYMTGDQRFAARRPDVLVYESGPLESDLTLVGPLVADLHVSTSGTDCDWIVKLIDVYPNDTPDPTPNPAEVRMGGYQQLVRGEVMRGRFRNSLEKPEPFVAGQTTPVKFTLPDVCHTFRAGHKVMVQVQSSWFPLIDRNPQTYVDPLKAKESDFQKATQRVYRSRETPSKVAGQALR